jgi:hypothetical protein
LFRPLSGTDLILGAVGTLQFDVVASRLENEYGVQVIFEHYNCATARWIHGDAGELRQLSDRYSANVALDGADDPVYLAPNNVYLNMVKEKYPNLRFLEAREVAAGIESHLDGRPLGKFGGGEGGDIPQIAIPPQQDRRGLAGQLVVGAARGDGPVRALPRWRPDARRVVRVGLTQAEGLRISASAGSRKPA